MENEEKDVDLNNEEEETTEETTDESAEETEEESTTEEETEDKPKESLEDRRARLQRQLKQVNKKLGVEVKKPEQKPSVQSSSDGLTDKDLIAIINNKVHEDDIDSVKKIAKLEGVSVAEALKLDLTQAILAKNAEHRKSAELANTGASRKGAQKVSDEALQKNLSEGKVPEKGTDEAERLYWARRGGKR